MAHLEHNHGPDETEPERPSTCCSPPTGTSNRGQGRTDGRIEGEVGPELGAWSTGSSEARTTPQTVGPSRRRRMMIPAARCMKLEIGMGTDPLRVLVGLSRETMGGTARPIWGWVQCRITDQRFSSRRGASVPLSPCSGILGDSSTSSSKAASRMPAASLDSDSKRARPVKSSWSSESPYWA